VSVTVEEIALQVVFSEGTAYSLVHDILFYRKVSARWVHKHLKEGHEHNCQHICCSVLEQCNHKDDNFMNGIITEDESCIHHHEPENK
jgi:hypothetical protein